MSTELNRWAKNNGFNPRYYSDKELSQLRQLKYQLEHSSEWDDGISDAFYKSFKRFGLSNRW